MTRFCGQTADRRFLAAVSLFILCSFLLRAAAIDPETAEGGENSAMLGISANPGAINQTTGTGAAGRFIEKHLGLKKDTGISLGGVWVGDTNFVISGGADPHAWSFNSLFILGLGIDFEKVVGWKGAKFGIEFLQFNGQHTNQQAGSAQGYNSLPGPDPLNRSELYQLWLRQELFDGRLVVRVGKIVPTNDFGNVLRPVPTQDDSLAIPSVSGLAFTPVFVNPTMLGVMPGYYNSASGLTATVAPTDNIYLSYGFYDGNIANGTQTGMTGPQFNGYYFHIWEGGAAWEIPAGKAGKLPGSFGLGLWHQTGLLSGPGVTEDGAGGLYLFGSQRLWLQRPGIDNSGISAFAQFGANNSITLPFNQYFGAGPDRLWPGSQSARRLRGRGRRPFLAEQARIQPKQRTDVPGLLSGKSDRDHLSAAGDYLYSHARP